MSDEYVMSSEEKAARGKMWWAWLQTLAGFCSQIISSTATNCYTITVALIATEFGVNATDLAIASSAYGATYAGFSFLWGGLADRIGLRFCISLAGAWVGVGYLVISTFASDPVSFAVLMAITGVGAGGINSATLSKCIGTWYTTDWRGKGCIIVNMGGNAASSIMGFASPILLAGGWHSVYRTMGIVYIISAAIMLLFLRDSPAAIGTVPFLSPKGTLPEPYVKQKAMSPEEKAEAKRIKNEGTKLVLKDPMTWKFGIIYAFWQLQMNSNKAFMVAAIVASGLGDAKFGGMLMGGFSFAMMFGMPIISFLGDYFPRKCVFGAGVLVCAALFGATWVVFGTGNSALLVPMFSVLGFCSGTVGISWVMMSECFTPDCRGFGPGVVSTFGIVGRVGGPLLAAGWINAFFGGNTASYTLFAALMMLIAGVLIFLWLPMTSGKLVGHYGDPLADKYYAEHPELKPTVKNEK